MAPSPIKVDNKSEAEGEMTPAQLKGKAHAVPKKSSGKSEASVVNPFHMG